MPLTPASLNALLDARVRDLAARRHPSSLQDHLRRVKEDRPKLMQCLGLEPLPQLCELNAQVTGTIQRDGYRIDKIVYESRQGFYVTAHLYLPESEKAAPIVLRPHGHWQGKKSEPTVQASAIGLVLSGYAVLVVDSPGDFGEPAGLNERAAQGPHNDFWLSMGTPMIGLYAWDLMRGIDYLRTRPEVDVERIGITGASGGGLAALYAFAADDRIKCAAPVCYATSMEAEPRNGCLCNHVPGVTEIGDRSDVLALRAPAPILVIGATDDPEFPPAGASRTHEKLRSIYRLYDREQAVRAEIVESQHDYNRRMRESVLAFFDEHLMGLAKRSYRPEPRPITDGYFNSYPAETVPRDDPELLVLQEHRPTRTMRDLLEESILSPSPRGFDAKKRFVPWAKYGKLASEHPGGVVALDDYDLNLNEIDQRFCIYLGISVCEFYAQVLHLSLPGGFEGWEQSTLGAGGDVVTSLIGSMKALVHANNPASPVTEINAQGPCASMIALHFKTLRPAVTITVTHQWSSWLDLYRSEIETLSQPLARYLSWPAI
ncbi:MAG TPA: acetylxylan esterase [Fimbriimonas sp.]|nr:acetylxylan esterase [Fimbriimonas sp.]